MSHSYHNTPINPHERLIVALDVQSKQKAKQLIESLGDSVHFYKIGLELFMTGGGFELIKYLKKKEKQIFVDLKFHDVPRTVEAAVTQLSKHGVDFITVHGYPEVLEAAVDARNSSTNEVKILAVTVLTSLDSDDLMDMNLAGDPQKIALKRAQLASELDCDGVITSGHEVSVIKEKFKKLIAVTPGIRPKGASGKIENDDQKRIVTPTEAFENGADYIVIGRPIVKHNNRKKIAQKIQKEIKECFQNPIFKLPTSERDSAYTEAMPMAAAPDSSE